MGIVTTTKVINRVVLGMAAGILLIAGLVPKFSALLTTIPQCVLGGGVEYRAVQIALEAMKERTSYIEGFTLTGDQASDIGMVCGGDVTVYFQYISPEDSAVRCV